MRAPKTPEARIAMTLCALLLLAVPAGRAAADDCQAACSDARQTCMTARTAALKSCWSGCRDTVAEATRSARQICQQESLRPSACGKLLKQTVAGAEHACHDDCRVAARQAKAVCSAERVDCRQACAEAVDPACLDACTADFRSCRQDLGTCTDGCREERRSAIDACRQQALDVCDPVMLRECVRTALGESLSCVQDCHDQTTCGDTLHECVGDCAPAPAAATGL